MLSFIARQKQQTTFTYYYLFLFLSVKTFSASNESFLKRIQPKWKPLISRYFPHATYNGKQKKTNFYSHVSHIRVWFKQSFDILVNEHKMFRNLSTGYCQNLNFNEEKLTKDCQWLHLFSKLNPIPFNKSYLNFFAVKSPIIMNDCNNNIGVSPNTQSWHFCIA